jgi:hypothetical protein
MSDNRNPGNNNTVDICSELFYNLTDKGMEAQDVNKLVRDLFKILGDGGVFTVGFINSKLEEAGWEAKMVDDHIVELVLAILKKEFDYSVNSHTVH